MNQQIARFRVQLAVLLAALLATPAWALPNWSGIWEVVGLKTGASGVFETSTADIVREFGAHPPFTAQGAASMQAFMRDVFPTMPEENTCTFGFPTVMMESPLMFEVLITPQETAMIFSGREIRHIYTDGRKQRPADELFPTHWGSSVGHWEGGTLVVDTVRIDPVASFLYVFDGRDLFEPLVTLSEEASFSERIRMLPDGTLEDQLTITDATQFSKPWRITHRYQHAQGVRWMLHEDCEGNDRNPVVNGKTTLKLQ